MTEDLPHIIIGAGPAGLMAAQILAEMGCPVIIYEKNKAAARKFLVAGDGGFNLTHSENIDEFIKKYSTTRLNDIIAHFDNADTINWLKKIGIETFVGSSGKVFPIKGTKPIQVLNAWLKYLNGLSVKIYYQHNMVDFNENNVWIENNSSITPIQYKKLILAMGGASWPQTGSNGKWKELIQKKQITIKPLESANSGYETKNSYKELEGKVLKNISVRFNEIEKKGEITFTHYGIEGAPIYYLNRYTRGNRLPTTIYLNLKPNLNYEKSLNYLKHGKSITSVLKNDLNCNDVIIQLLKKLPKDVFQQPESLLDFLQNYPIEIMNFRPIEEVISTAGGISWDALNNDLSLKKYPNIICVGEMVDWEAPTGGYLLQGCFSMGAYAGSKILSSLKM